MWALLCKSLMRCVFHLEMNTTGPMLREIQVCWPACTRVFFRNGYSCVITGAMAMHVATSARCRGFFADVAAGGTPLVRRYTGRTEACVRALLRCCFFRVILVLTRSILRVITTE